MSPHETMIISRADNLFPILLHQYLPCFSYCINVANCKKKIDQELALFKNFTRELPERAHGLYAKYYGKYTDDMISAAQNIDISMIGASLLNTPIRQVEKLRDIEILSVSIHDIKIAIQSKKFIHLTTKILAKFHDY